MKEELQALVSRACLALKPKYYPEPPMCRYLCYCCDGARQSWSNLARSFCGKVENAINGISHFHLLQELVDMGGFEELKGTLAAVRERLVRMLRTEQGALMGAHYNRVAHEAEQAVAVLSIREVEQALTDGWKFRELERKVLDAARRPVPGRRCSGSGDSKFYGRLTDASGTIQCRECNRNLPPRLLGGTTPVVPEHDW